MQKTETKKQIGVLDTMSIPENKGLTSDAVDKLLAELDELKNDPESELKTNINKLIDQIEGNDELKYLVQDRQQNKIISQNTLNKLRLIDNMNDTEFISFDGTIENLLLLAEDSDALAFAIENHTDKIVERFKEINYRYALIKEHPRNHTCLLHHVFDISMKDYIAKDKNFFKRFNIPTKHEYDARSLSRELAKTTSGVSRSIIVTDKYYFNTKMNTPDRYAMFDRFGNVEIFLNSDEDNETVKLMY